MNYLDLFSGIGGFALALERCKLKIDKHYFSEIDSNAIKLYQNKFNKAVGLGDVKTIKTFSKLKKIDLITFGFPCQDLSIAGKGAGFNGTRSSLFYEATRIIKEVRPTCFIFENVKGLFSNDHGRTFEKVLQEIADIGLYECEWQLVNTSWILPQNRERIYFIGHLRGKSHTKVFPFKESDFKLTEEHGIKIFGSTSPKTGNKHRSYLVYSSNGICGSLLSRDYKQPKQIAVQNIVDKTKNNPQATRINSIQGNNVTLQSQSGEQNAKTGLHVIPRGNNLGGYREVNNCPTITTSHFERNNFVCIGSTQKKASVSNNVSPTLTSAMGMGGGHVPMVIPVLTPNRVEKRQNGRRFKNNGDPSFTLATQDRHGIYDGFSIRRLTPLECERLQGFPDGWTAGFSDNQRYKMLGNAVSVPIAELILKRLYGVNQNA